MVARLHERRAVFYHPSSVVDETLFKKIMFLLKKKIEKLFEIVRREKIRKRRGIKRIRTEEDSKRNEKQRRGKELDSS